MLSELLDKADAAFARFKREAYVGGIPDGVSNALRAWILAEITALEEKINANPKE
jgi:hypothetical protein